MAEQEKEPVEHDYDVTVSFTIPIAAPSALSAADMIADTVRNWMVDSPQGLDASWFRFNVMDRRGWSDEYRLSKKSGRVRHA